MRRAVGPAKSRGARTEFWKREPPKVVAPAPVQAPAAAAPVEVRVELAPGVHVVIALPEGASIASADVHALRAAAAPFVAELARRGLTVPDGATLEES